MDLAWSGRQGDLQFDVVLSVEEEERKNERAREK
jgi:hypothetical protein